MIVVALSGGVDSATAAALLVEAGERVVGITMRLYDAAGTRRLELAVPSEGPRVTVFDAQGKQRRILVAPPGLLETETLQEDGNTGPVGATDCANDGDAIDANGTRLSTRRFSITTPEWALA